MKTLLFILSALFTFSVSAQNWYQVSVPTSNSLLAIDFPSSMVGYIVGENATILKSNDGGQSWTILPTTGIQIQPFPQSITDVDFLNEQVGFIVVSNTGTYKTVDGGQSWTFFTGQNTTICFPKAVLTLSESKVFVGGAGCFEGAIIEEYSMGNWTRNTPAGLFWDSEEKIQEIDFINGNLGLAAVKNQFMLRTTNGGQDWDTIPTGLGTDAFLTSVLMVNDTLCYAGYGDLSLGGFGVLKSVDAGVTWALDVNSATFFYPEFRCVAASAIGGIYAGAKPSNTSGGLIFETTVGSTGIWDYELVDQPINDMATYGNDIAFGVGDSGYVVVNVPVATIGQTEMDEIEVNIYPNPASSELFIESTSTISKLEVRDIAGKSHPVNVKVANGSQLIDVSALSSGIYYLIGETEKGSFSQRFCINR